MADPLFAVPVMTAAAIAERFTNARRAGVAEILETLCAMGRAHRGNGENI